MTRSVKQLFHRGFFFFFLSRDVKTCLSPVRLYRIKLRVELAFFVSSWVHSWREFRCFTRYWHSADVRRDERRKIIRRVGLETKGAPLCGVEPRRKEDTWAKITYALDSVHRRLGNGPRRGARHRARIGLSVRCRRLLPTEKNILFIVCLRSNNCIQLKSIVYLIKMKLKKLCSVSRCTLKKKNRWSKNSDHCRFPLFE